MAQSDLTQLRVHSDAALVAVEQLFGEQGTHPDSDLHCGIIRSALATGHFGRHFRCYVRIIFGPLEGREGFFINMVIWLKNDYIIMQQNFFLYR